MKHPHRVSELVPNNRRVDRLTGAPAPRGTRIDQDRAALESNRRTATPELILEADRQEVIPLLSLLGLDRSLAVVRRAVRRPLRYRAPTSARRHERLRPPRRALEPAARPTAVPLLGR